jgi:hypothetical protein
MSFDLFEIVFDDRKRNIMIKKSCVIIIKERKRKNNKTKKRKSRAKKEKKNYNWHFLFSYYIEKP